MIRVALIGFGFIGKAHLTAYEKIETCEVAAILTRKKVEDPDAAMKYAGRFTDDFDALLLDKEIDIIDICLPTYLHEEYIIKAANAGKHIICEKPLTLTLDSMERIFAAVNKNGVRLFVGHILRFWPEYKLIKSYSETAPFNEIEFVHTVRLGQAPYWSGWFRQPEKSGGVLFDLHVHDIDFLHQMLGKADSVYSAGGKNKWGAWDHVMTTIKFKNGRIAFAEASHRMPPGFPFTMNIRAAGGGGGLEFAFAAGRNIENMEEATRQLTVYKEGKKVAVVPKSERTDPFLAELSYFLGCIESGEKNDVIPLEEVRYTMELLAAIKESLETESEVRL